MDADRDDTANTPLFSPVSAVDLRRSLEARRVLSLCADVALANGATIDEVLEPGRSTRRVTKARWAVWAALRGRHDYSYWDLGRLFGRHASTIFDGVRTHVQSLTEQKAAS